MAIFRAEYPHLRTHLNEGLVNIYRVTEIPAKMVQGIMRSDIISLVNISLIIVSGCLSSRRFSLKYTRCTQMV